MNKILNYNYTHSQLPCHLNSFAQDSSSCVDCYSNNLLAIKKDGFFTGLKLSNNKLVTDKKRFACCEGSGFYASHYYNLHNDKLIESYAVCSLGQRLSKANTFLASFSKTTKQKVNYLLAKPYSLEIHSEILQKLNKIANNDKKNWTKQSQATITNNNNHPRFGSNDLKILKQQGMLCNLNNYHEKDGDYADVFALNLGLFFNWRLNLEIDYIDLQNCDESYLAMKDFDVLIIQAKKSIWKKQMSFMLEKIIDFCYHSQRAMWIIISRTNHHKNTYNYDLQHIQKNNLFNAKNLIKDLKSQDLLSYLNKSSIARLREICVI